MAKKTSRRPQHGRNLSTAQEDYLETILQLERETDQVRISEIAQRLGIRLPSVTRAVQALNKLGYVDHEVRRSVRLTEKGRLLAAALSHRHADLYGLLTAVLGVSPEVAEADTCQMEHGISPETAQRLHEFLEHLDVLDATTRQSLQAKPVTDAFEFLPDGRGAGWRA